MLNKIFTILKSKLFYFFLAVVFGIPFLYEHLPVRIDITQQSSLDNKLWITYKDITKDTDYVLFMPPLTRYTKNRDIKYLKKIGCKEGQTLSINNLSYFCDGRLLGVAQERDMFGEKMDRFIFNGVVPRDKYFVVGTHKFSFDSRYFGFIDKNEILRKARPFN